MFYVVVHVCNEHAKLSNNQTDDHIKRKNPCTYSSKVPTSTASLSLYPPFETKALVIAL